MSKTILIAGGSGLVGKRLTSMLENDGYTIHILSRKRKKDKGNVKWFTWDLESMTIDKEATNVDHIINLTGAGIADKPWTEKRKKEIIDSRTKAAELIRKNILCQSHDVTSYVSASAVGYYGDRHDEELTEDSTLGNGFMAETCKAWEAAAWTLQNVVDRVVIHRIGIVLSTKGGALPKILMTKPIFSYFGNGQQYYPWIHIDDVCRIFMKSISCNEMGGVYNCVAPHPVSNKDLVLAAKKVYNGWLSLPAPAFVLRAALCEMSDVILNSTRAIPSRLEEEGFSWSYPHITEAIADLKEKSL